MTVAFDAVGPSSAGTATTSGTTLSWAHTCSGSNRLLTVGVAVGAVPDTGITTTATYSGVSMTSVGVVHPGGGTSGYAQLFQLVAPATGANTVQVTTTAAATITAGSVSFTGVNQSSPLGTPATASDTAIGASATVTVTGTTTGNMVVDALAQGSGGASTSGQTLRWQAATNGASRAGCAAQSTAAAGGSVTMSYTWSTADHWGILAAEVQAAASGQSGAATLTGTGALTAAATVAEAPAAPLAGAGALTTAASATQAAAAALAGTGALTTAGSSTQAAAGALSGTGVLSAAGFAGTSAPLAAAGALSVAPTDTTLPTALLAGAGSLIGNAAGGYVPYTPEGWTDNSLATPLSAARLNYMESGMVGIDTAQQGKAPLLVPAPVQTSSYSAQVSDLVPVDLTAQSVSVTLPTAPANKAQVGVEIVTAGPSHTCTVITGGTDVLYKAGGATTYVLSVQGETAVFEYQVSGAIWHVVSAGTPRAQLDNRYVQSVTAGNATITVGGTATAPTIALGAVAESAIANLTADLASKVASVSAADSTITVAGTATAPTVKVGTIAESQVSNLTTDLAGKAPTASPSFTGTVTVPHLAGSGSVPAAAAGANNGTSPPAPVITGSDLRGKVTFGSGTTPAAGAQVTVTFTTAYSAAPVVALTATTSAAQALGAYLSAVSTTGFTISTSTAPTASQANTMYGVNFMCLG